MAEVGQYDLGDGSFVENENEYCRRVIEEKIKNTRNSRRKRRRHRPRRDILWPGRYISNYYDSMKAFRSSGILVVSDSTIESRPCEERLYMLRGDMVGFMPGAGVWRMAGAPGPMDSDVMDSVVSESDDSDNSAPEFKPVVDVRTYFPETWLWDLHFVGSSGENDVDVTLPHTVTSWVGGGFCTNLNSGLGVSASTTIKGFQPFFVSLTLPYSVIRNEKIKLPVTVFNYLTDCLNVQLTIEGSDDLAIEGDTEQGGCVCGQETMTKYFNIKPTNLGDVNVTVRAVSVDNNGICGNRIFATDHVDIRDAVVRTLLVEPEGEPQEYSQTSFICPAEDEMYVEEMMLEMPDNVVPDTPKAMVKVIGDLMGPALDDIDKLLAMPYGCGEQNMLKFAPNIFVMQYLQGVNEVTERIKATSQEYLQQGYQRELTYRHTDGSYSAFGNSDDSGSMWLTAFVLKSFAQATPLIYIDEQNLAASIDWVIDEQLENGCFPKVGRVLHKGMKGGLSGDNQSPATLTAFVLIALLEAREYTEIPDAVIMEALFCIDSFMSSADTYTLALMAYAHSLYDVTSENRASVMALLEERVVTQGDMKHWTAGSGHEQETPHHYGHNNAKAVDIEITAYMLLAYTAQGAQNSIGNGLPLVYWLSKQRSPGGGFSSTQDTVIALQALARYAALAYTDTMNVMVMVNGTNMQQMFMVDNDNKMVMQKAHIQMPNELMVQANGTGCVFVQTSVQYHVMDIPVPEPAFSLSAVVKQVSSSDGCRRRDIKVCTRYLLDDGYSNMAVITVKMVSGWIPDKDSVKALMNRVEVMLKKYEIEPNLVNFYFDEITSDDMCFTFQVEQNVEVDEAKPGYVEVYDYYEKELRVSTAYTISNVCGTKQELPHLTVDEYNDILDQEALNPGGIEQRRVPAVVPNWDELEEVVEEPIVPEVVVPLGEGDNGPLSLCPHCYDELPSEAILRTLFCNADYAYKVSVKRRTYAVKIVSDIRPSSGKRRIEQFADFNMAEGCQCNILSTAERNSYVMILQDGAQEFDLSAQSLSLSADSHVMPMQRSAERLLTKMGKQADCTP